MIEFKCDVCDNLVIFDEVATRLEYYLDADYLVDDVGKIIDETLQQYLVYKCTYCNKIYKLTYVDWEYRVREKIAKDIMLARKFNVFKNIVDPSKVDPDNGLEWCGKCDGIEDGYCFTDIIKVCNIRQGKLNVL
jgi:hypothetical protein